MIASCASLIAGREKQTICIFFGAGQTHLKSIISPINFLWMIAIEVLMSITSLMHANRNVSQRLMQVLNVFNERDKFLFFSFFPASTIKMKLKLTFKSQQVFRGCRRCRRPNEKGSKHNFIKEVDLEKLKSSLLNVVLGAFPFFNFAEVMHVAPVIYDIAVQRPT